MRGQVMTYIDGEIAGSGQAAVGFDAGTNQTTSYTA